uniref:hypothetical protein n=1 Tax=Russula rosea TaxID=176822 RepID=UPI002028FE41|nr:hypothetical protein NDC34_mgp07 [Russula rosea]UHA57047.1 hypothetical protein [Russula rosea]
MTEVENLLTNNNICDYGILIACGISLCCTVYLLILSNNIANLPNNTEDLTNQEIEAIENEIENRVLVSNIENIEDFLTDSDFETDSSYDNISDYESANEDDFSEIWEDPDLVILPPFETKFRNVEFIMPDVDLNVCPIEELKLFEFCSLYGKEMAEHSVTDEEMMDIICLFQEEELATNWINDLLLAIIELL